MEIALAVLLLFGGFTLGSISSEKGDNEPLSSMELPHVDGATKLHPITQIMSRIDPTQCHYGAVIYRDLTIPYSGQTGDCGSNCSNE